MNSGTDSYSLDERREQQYYACKSDCRGDFLMKFPGSLLCQKELFLKKMVFKKRRMEMGTGILKTVTENVQFVLVCALVILAVVGLAMLAERTVLKNRLAQAKKTQYITICGMFGAVAMLLHLFDFSVVFLAPEFYKLDFSEIPVMIGAFYLGPVGGVLIELVKILLKLVIKGTSTAFVGDLANFIIGCSFVVPAAVLYHMNKSKKTALAALVAGTAVMTVFGSLFNAWYLLPAFSKLYGIPLDALVGMGTAVNPAINSVSMLVLLAVAPLNLLKGVLISVPTMVLYKRISRVLHNAAQNQGAVGNSGLNAGASMQK